MAYFGKFAMRNWSASKASALLVVLTILIGVAQFLVYSKVTKMYLAPEVKVQVFAAMTMASTGNTDWQWLKVGGQKMSATKLLWGVQQTLSKAEFDGLQEQWRLILYSPFMALLVELLGFTLIQHYILKDR